MLLIDAVCALEPNTSIIARKCVTGSEACYAGVADNAPLPSFAYPPSLIVESFGQAGALLWLASAPPGQSQGVLMFASARDIFFESDAFPGDTLEHHVHLERAIADSVIFSGETRVETRRIARFDWLMAAIRSAQPPQPE